MSQLSFLGPEDYPPGFSYVPSFITEEEELYLLTIFKSKELKNYIFQGYTALRKVLSFHNQNLPDELQPFLVKAAKFLDVPARSINHILITHYPVGAPIGWHRDASSYEHLVGISLGSSCMMKLREINGKEKMNILLEPRSAYKMTGVARWNWEHHIPPMKEERYSLTFRTMVKNYSRYSSSAS